MALYEGNDLLAAEAVAELCYTNPFTARRIELEREALGRAFQSVQTVSSRTSSSFVNPNVPGLRERTRELLAMAGAKLERGYAPSEQELALHAGVVRYRLFDVCDAELRELVEAVRRARIAHTEHASDGESIACYAAFRQEAERLGVVDGPLRGRLPPVPHLFSTSVGESADRLRALYCGANASTKRERDASKGTKRESPIACATRSLPVPLGPVIKVGTSCMFA
jgi:hypothetical protein